MKVEAIQHTDVRGKILYYLRISNGANVVLVNVGIKTYESVTDLTKQTELPFNGKLVIEDKKK